MTNTQWRRAAVVALVSALWVTAWSLGTAPTRAAEDDVPTRSTRSGSSRPAVRGGEDSSRSTRTSDEGREGRLEAKLDQVLANQDAMLAKLDQMMEELKVIKIRATVR
jgi:hypothetical protein